MPFAHFDKLNANGGKIFSSVRAELVEAYERLFYRTCASYRGDSGASERHGSHPHQLMGTRPITRRNPREPLVCSAEGHKTLCEKNNLSETKIEVSGVKLEINSLS